MESSLLKTASVKLEIWDDATFWMASDSRMISKSIWMSLTLVVTFITTGMVTVVCLYYAIQHFTLMLTAMRWQNRGKTMEIVGGVLVYRCQLASIGIPIIRIMRSQERLIFFMEIPIYGGTVFILRGCPYLSSIKPGQFESCINVQLGIAVLSTHDNLIKWKHFPHKCQWRGALMFSLICVWINDWVNNRESGNLRRYRAHYDVIVMCVMFPKHHAVDSTAIPSWS